VAHALHRQVDCALSKRAAAFAARMLGAGCSLVEELPGSPPKTPRPAAPYRATAGRGRGISPGCS